MGCDNQPMPIDYDTLWLGALGGAGALAAQWILKHLENSRIERSTMREEQKKLARDLLVRIERYCTEATRRRYMEEKLSSPIDDPLNLMREQIASDAVAILNRRAREHMGAIDWCMWYVLCPSAKKFAHMLAAPNPHSISVAAREVLGAIQRGEQVPDELPDLQPLVDASHKFENLMERQLQAQEQRAKEAAGHNLTVGEEPVHDEARSMKAS
jgi:hypothetical protein